MSLHAVVRDLLPGVLNDLKDLVAIESVSADPAQAGEVERSALTIIRLLVETGCPDARVIRGNGGAPAVIARYPAPAGMPTVCLYAHHDVQPEGDPAGWATPPFVATEISGRLFGRGER
jgi:cysteinylglycine-S-conjugate dipeptidase